MERVRHMFLLTALAWTMILLPSASAFPTPLLQLPLKHTPSPLGPYFSWSPRSCCACSLQVSPFCSNVHGSIASKMCFKTDRLAPMRMALKKDQEMDLESSPSKVNATIQLAKTLWSTLSFILLELVFRKVLLAYQISFPPSLVGCAALFTLMTTLYVIPISQKLGDDIYNFFAPGSIVLTKWLPVFFVPSLVTLPLAPSPGSMTELIKALGVIVGGFFFSLFSTAFTVLTVKKFKGNGAARSSQRDLELTRKVIADFILGSSSSDAPVTTTTKPFSTRTFQALSTTAVLSIMASIIAFHKLDNKMLTTPLQATAMLFTTLSSFVLGARLPKSFKKFFHPLLTCTTITWSVMKLISSLTHQTFHQMLQSYKVGSLCPVHLGAGDVLLFMLGPAVIALACQMYNRKELMRDNIFETGSATIMSSVGGLFGTAYLVKYMNLSSHVLRTSLLSRNITAAMALAIANMLNTSPSLAVSAVVITGLLGANFGASILDAARIRDPVARGMAIGSAAHGLGTAAFTEEKDAFPFAAISMALTACASTVLVSIPVIKSALLKIALG